MASPYERGQGMSMNEIRNFLTNLVMQHSQSSIPLPQVITSTLIASTIHTTSNWTFHEDSDISENIK